MSAFPAKVILFASTALLVGVGVALATDSQTQRRSDLSGQAVRRPTPSSVSTSTSGEAVVRASSRLSPQNNVALNALDRSTSATDAPELVSGTQRVTETPTSTMMPKLRSRPLRLSIPSLNVSAPVVAVGLEPDGSMEIPDASEAGWYELGPQPGDQAGSAVIAGHVDQKGQEGVFIDLRLLQVGAEVSVFDADGTQLRFTVFERYQVDKDELPAPELFRRAGEPVLTLITCGGRFSKRKHSYSDNIIVRAVPMPESVTGA
jgi:LPXTG-site transpeptidase (sortase) family protein